MIVKLGKKIFGLFLGKMLSLITNYRIEKQVLPQLRKYVPMGGKSAVHISAFDYGNAGDTLLPVILRDLFNLKIGVSQWSGIAVHKFVTMRELDRINKNDFVVIGGGGLFLKDTAPNNVSGWQWNCSIESLLKINKPLVAFAIGYNRFRNQEEFNPIFKEHLNAFVDKSIFVGIRNHGSIEKLKQYLDDERLKEKLTFQPCMTTLISLLYPEMYDYNIKQDFIAFNCAFDRESMRDLSEETLDAIAHTAYRLSSFTKIKFYSHVSTDKNILPYFEKYGFKYDVIDMHNISKMIEDYNNPRLVIGMRGHAQMIPFGCSTPILSIVSHDKLQWFLDDINHPEWGVDVRNPQFKNELYTKAVNLYQNYQKIQSEIIIEQNKLWKITMNNMKTINEFIGNTILPPPGRPRTQLKL